MNKQIIITTSWDDGHKLDFKIAKLLKKYGIKGTFYIAPKNREFRKEDLLSDEEIIKISKDFEIGAHTMTHLKLTKISESEAIAEIADSKKYLERIINDQVRCFCYPNGKYNKKIMKFVEKSGFCYSRTMRKFEFNLAKNLLSSRTTLETHRNSLLTLPIDSLKILKFLKFNFVEATKSLNWEYLAKKTFDHVENHGGIYHLWGHSWVIEKSNDWKKIERVLSYIGNKKNVKYCTNYEISKVLK